MQDSSELLRIGELAERAGVATSAIRYYERRGLLSADVRRGGQRYYTHASLRKLVFVGMLQDAGLSLDEIDGILRAPTVADWKQIARRRLDALEQEAARIEHMRALLAGALLCRYDHPLDECKVMGGEIERRLAVDC